MKKLFTLLFAAALVTAASAQSGDRQRSDSRSYNSYQSSPYSNNNQNGYSNQYQNGDQYNRNSQWNDQYSRNSQLNDRGDQNRYDRDRRRAEQQRYEMMMRRRQDLRYDRRYDDRSSGLVLPLLGLLAAIISQRYPGHGMGSFIFHLKYRCRSRKFLHNSFPIS